MRCEYQKSWLRADVLAGVTTAAVVVPKSMAFAGVAGLPVQAGLYVALVPMFVYAMIGSSRQLSVSSTTTLAILTGAQLHAAAPEGDPASVVAAASTLALLTGVILLLAGALRLGFLANFISDPVLTGFKAGIGLVILVDQAPKLLGIHIDNSGFLRDALSIIRKTPEANLPTVAVAALLLAMIIIVECFLPRVPAPLVSVIIGILAAGLMGLKQMGVALTGAIPAGIPVPALPDLSLVKILWPGALGLALMSFTESIAAGRAFARQDDPRPAPNRELLALGAANLAGGFFRCFPAGGGTSQTAVNAAAGARTQVAQLVTVAVVLAVLLVMAPAVALLPQAALAAVVVATTVPLFGLKEFRAIRRIRGMEFRWALVTLVGVVVLGTLPGILIAVGISILSLMYHANRPPVYAVGRDRGTGAFVPLTDGHLALDSLPGLLIVRTEGRMTFASAPQVIERLWALVRDDRPRVLILECSAIPDFEYTALNGLARFEERLHGRGIDLWLAGLNPEPRKTIPRSPVGRTLGADRIFTNVAMAVDSYQSALRETTVAATPVAAGQHPCL